LACKAATCRATVSPPQTTIYLLEQSTCTNMEKVSTVSSTSSSQESVQRHSTIGCKRCGRVNHTESQCYAKTSVGGIPLPPIQAAVRSPTRLFRTRSEPPSSPTHPFRENSIGCCNCRSSRHSTFDCIEASMNILSALQAAENPPCKRHE
jgi:hypothetical protein